MLNEIDILSNSNLASINTISNNNIQYNNINNLTNSSNQINTPHHHCTTIINIDDEQCILNMNKNLIMRKLNIEINTCINSNELNTVLTEMKDCVNCKNKIILIICD